MITTAIITTITTATITQATRPPGSELPDDGVGDSLPEFIALQIKIVMTGTNTAEPPRLKALRVIALGT